MLTLPVVIVAAEEALAAVPNSMRQGSYACGAGKWQTIWRIVLPQAMPGIMTGLILAVARAAGEVAPLMLIGVLKSADDLPIDAEKPFLHLDRSFMHLGFHIFDLGFQSPNSDEVRPMLFSTVLVLILTVGILNLAAIRLRTRLKRRFQSSKF
jgi:ABC-type phosphate transport system permease subunit